MESAIWSLLGAIVGAAASIATAWLAARSSYELQRKKSAEDRADRASSFQRETLLEVQEAIHDSLRLASRAHHEDLKAYRTTKEWGQNMLPDDLSEGVRLAQRRVAILVERIADDQLRVAVKGLMRTVTTALLAQTEREAEFHMNATAKESESLFEGIGVVLRRHLG